MALMAGGARFARRAAMRGSLGAGAGALLWSPWRRRRPGLASAAAVGGLVIGAAQELPLAGVPGLLALVALLLRAPRRAPAMLVGVGAAVATRRWWPVAPRTAAEVRRASNRAGAIASDDGEGVAIVVNASAGPGHRSGAAEELGELLPRADVREMGDDDDLLAMLEKAAASATVLGVAGGDGSINAAAAIAHARRMPLLAVPAGTLNHFARDLGVAGAADAVAALADGRAVAVDLATIDGHPFLNTASFGAYPQLVDARERLEGRIGKWPAMLVALIEVLRRSTPCEVVIDGRPRRLWMAFIGNCRYHPHGFAPSWRARLDDGMLDVRLVDADQPFGRTRLVLAVLTGRLGRSRVWEERTVRRLEVRSLHGPMRLARDGETFDGPELVVIEKAAHPLVVYAPPPEEEKEA